MYDRVLRLRLTNETTIMGFADDIAIVSVAKTVREIEEKTNTTIRNIGAWLTEAGLTLAAHKTEAVLISGQNILTKMEVIIDDRLNFKAHVKYIGEKASVIQGALTRMMEKLGGPGLFKTRIISAVDE